MDEFNIEAIRAILRRTDGWESKETLIQDWLDGCEFKNKQANDIKAIYDRKMKEHEEWLKEWLNLK